jgi:hypothetical protein
MVWNGQERRDPSTRIEILEVIDEADWGFCGVAAFPQDDPPDAGAPSLDCLCSFI